MIHNHGGFSISGSWQIYLFDINFHMAGEGQK